MKPFFTLSALAVLLALAPASLAQDLAPRVFPNPVAEDRAVTVEVADAEAATIEVVDVLGRQISSRAPLASGTYLVRVRYADGRVTEPTSVTVATPGAIEFRLAEAVAAKAQPGIASVPAPVEAYSRGGCSGDVPFGGFYHTAFTGQLNLRPDLTPKSMRAKPPIGSSTVDWTTCFGSVQGFSFRYIAGLDVGNRPLRVLSPSTVGNTQASYTVDYEADTTPRQALFGTFEVSIDNDGDGGTAPVPAVQVGFDADFTTLTRNGSANRGGGYQLLVFDDETLVYEAFPGETTPVFVTPTGSATRINLLRSIMLSSVVDGFDVAGASPAPGDLKVAMTFESGDGAAVNFHVGEGAPVATGTSIHITPTFGFADPTTFEISDVRTFTTGVNRYGVRALQFAGGGGEEFVKRGGPAVINDGQWGRPEGEYVEPHVFDVLDAQGPFAFVGSAGPVEDYGIQFGREPASLQETGSNAIAINHGGGVMRGLAGVQLDADGDFYRGTARVRNESDAQAETITAMLSNVGGSQTDVLVENANGAFSTYEFIVDRDVDGSAEIRLNGTVGVPLSFSVSGLQVLASAAGEQDFDNVDPDQNFSVAFLIDFGSGNVGLAYVFPDWDTTDAEVDVRSYAAEADDPFAVSDVVEIDDEESTSVLHALRDAAQAD